MDLFDKLGSKLNVNWLKPSKKGQSSRDIIAKMCAFRKMEFDNFQKAITHLFNFATFAKKSNAVSVGKLLSDLAEYTGDYGYALNDALKPLRFTQIKEAPENDQMDLNPRIRVFQDLIPQFEFINEFIRLAEENLILSLLLKQKSEALADVSLLKELKLGSLLSIHLSFNVHRNR